MTNYEWYVENELTPALNWANSTDGMEFLTNKIKRTICNNVLFHSDDVLNKCYLITYKGIPLYLGETVRPWERAAVHLYHMATEPERYFGISSEELMDIDIVLIGKSIPDRDERRAAELKYREQYSPILNPARFKDRCIPKDKRYTEVHRFYNDMSKLGSVIAFVVFESGFCWGWTETMHKTYCCNPADVEVPDGLSTRIQEYISGLSKIEKRKLYMAVAIHVGGCTITTKTLVTVLTRILAGFESEEDIKKMAARATKRQIKIRMDFLKEMTAYQ